MSEVVFKFKQMAKDFVQSRYWPSRPQYVNFEISAACDARCIHCPRHEMDRPMKAMAMPLFRRMIDDCAMLGVPYLCPNGYGEICTIPVPQLSEYFDYMTSSGNFKIIINTNGNRMDDDRAEMFIRHGVKLINVTIDGATAATAESIRRNLDFDRIERNIKALIDKRDRAGKKYPKIRVGMVVMEQTLPEVDLFFRRWEGIADYVGMGGFSTRLMSVEKSDHSEGLVRIGEMAAQESEVESPPQASACVLPFRDLNIWADGKAVLCCEDWNEEHVVGDLSSQSLKEIWNSPRMNEVRELHMLNRGHEVELCAKCNNWQSPSRMARLWSS